MPYKVWVLNNNTIENVFIFGGKSDTAFSEEDRDMMMEFGITMDADIIIESPVQIHKDDSIMQVKKKIINEFGKDSGVTYHELYLFAYAEKLIEPYTIFYESVSPKTNYISRTVCEQLLHNLLDEFDPLDEDKDIYTYADFSKIVGNPRILNVPIGLGMLETSDHLFSPNPFYVVDFSPKNAIHTDNVLLFNHGKIVDNNIFVCLAGDVLSMHDAKSEFIAKTYYPLLTTKSVFDMESLLAKKGQLVAETDKIMDPRHFNSYRIVDMFYDMYGEDAQTSPFEYKENGVRKFEISLKPSYSFVMPIEAIFKNIQTTPKYKFMKLNLGIRRENIYRIYSGAKISKTGRKMPVLSREKINSLSKNMGKQKQLSVFVEESNMFIDIDIDGTIFISWDSKSKATLTVAQIEAQLLRDVNPLLETVNQYLQKSGYSIPMIQSIEDPNIVINSMDYVASIVLKKKSKSKEIKLSGSVGCLYSVFDIVSDFDKDKTTAQLRFKRVNNYREMDQQSLLITETFKKKGRESDVVEALMQNHAMTVDEAGQRIAQYLRDTEYKNVNGNVIEIMENPGLPIEMKIEKGAGMSSESYLEFTVEDISHLEYIRSLSVYFESMMRILQETGITESTKKMCAPPKKGAAAVEEEIAWTEEKIAKPVVHERVAAFDFSPTSKSPLAPFYEREEDADLSPRTKNGIQDLLDAQEEVKEEFILDSDDSSDLDLTGVAAADDDDDDLDMTGIDVEEDDSMHGGAAPKKSDSSEEDLYNVKTKDLAKNTNPFLEELKRKDPAVILQGKDGRSNVYARSCQSYRQPVVLTAEEKARIDRKSPGSYKKAMKYGSTPENEHYYICPRYWCFKTNTSVNDPSECDKDYLFEFKNQANPIEHMDAKGNYIDHYPGFIKKPGLKHCMPCCFASAWDTWKKDVKNKWTNQNKTTKWDKDGNKWKRSGKGEWIKQDIEGKERIDETGAIWKMNTATGEWEKDDTEMELPKNANKCFDGDSDETSESDNSAIEEPTPVNSSDTSIKNPDTKRVGKGQWAFLQYAVQHFLNVDYEGKIKTINGTKYLNDGVETFLRYGTDQNPANSLLGCLADLLGVKIGQIGKMLADAVTLDEFVRFGNGSFTATFRPPAIEIGDRTAFFDENDKEIGIDQLATKIKSIKINPDSYSETELYKTMNAANEDARATFWEMMAAYEVYKLYLSKGSTQSEETVDYTFVWDLVSRPNPKLFTQGINMVIMELPRNDITDSIDLICPTNTYGKTKFDVDKPTVFLVKSTYNQNVLFEPVYLYNSETKKPTRTFTKSMARLRPIIKMLNRTLNNYCRPKSSMPDVYEYKQPILLEELVDELTQLSYKIVKQVLNYQGKTIALQVTNPKTGRSVCVPCAPSAPLAQTAQTFMDNEELWTDYETTRAELTMINAASSGKIPCNPMLKMTEDKAMIVGLLTWTNQMVPINPPINDVPGDGLRTLPVDRNLVFGADVALTRETTGDTTRENIVRNARIESDMYSLFRTTIKTLLAKPENHRIRDYLVSETQTRKHGIQEIVQKLVRLTRNTVTFETFSESTLEQLGKQNELTYTCNKTKSALLKDGCKLILPKNNILVPTRDNRLLYFYRIADELLRFKQQSNYILNSKQIMNTGNTEYKVGKTEFIVLESTLSSNYYDDQTEMIMHPYMSGEIPYEMAHPEKVVKESNQISLDVQNIDTAPAVDLLHNCIDKMADLEGDPNKVFWIKEVFKAKKGNQYELHFKGGLGNENCTFGPFLKIAGELDSKKFDDIDAVRKILWESYRDLITQEDQALKQKNFEKIVEILRDRQGKTGLMKGVDSVEKFHAVIVSANYYMTTLDLYVMAQKLGLPIILFSNSSKNVLDDLGFTKDNWLIIGKRHERSADNKFYFVRSQKKIDGNVPSHSMVYKPFAITELNALKERVQSAFQGEEWRDHMLSIEEFLETY